MMKISVVLFIGLLCDPTFADVANARVAALTPTSFLQTSSKYDTTQSDSSQSSTGPSASSDSSNSSVQSFGYQMAVLAAVLLTLITRAPSVDTSLDAGTDKASGSDSSATSLGWAGLEWGDKSKETKQPAKTTDVVEGVAANVVLSDSDVDPKSDRATPKPVKFTWGVAVISASRNYVAVYGAAENANKYLFVFSCEEKECTSVYDAPIVYRSPMLMNYGNDKITISQLVPPSKLPSSPPLGGAAKFVELSKATTTVSDADIQLIARLGKAVHVPGDKDATKPVTDLTPFGKLTEMGKDFLNPAVKQILTKVAAKKTGKTVPDVSFTNDATVIKMGPWQHTY